jgi:hypothetical protein
MARLPPLDFEVLNGLAGNFRMIRMNPSHPSPVRAVNRGLAEARWRIVGVVIDGARMVTPGLLHCAATSARTYRAVARFAATVSGETHNNDEASRDALEWRILQLVHSGSFRKPKSSID